MNSRWVRVGCFLTGLNYGMVTGCSESTINRVKRYTSALLIICILWAFIGYTFTERYVAIDFPAPLIGSIIMVVVVIQIERLVILSSRENKWPIRVRGVIAFAMAVIGSVIVDQIIFKADIERQKVETTEAEVEELLPKRTDELKRQISSLDTLIVSKENERRALTVELAQNPTISAVSTKRVTQRPLGIDSLQTETVTRTVDQVENPRIRLLDPLNKQIDDLLKQRIAKDTLLLQVRRDLTDELKANVGFLHELKVLKELLVKSGIAMGVWILWFIILLGLEIFVLVGKLGERDTDYDARLAEQLALHMRRIELLGKQ